MSNIGGLSDLLSSLLSSTKASSASDTLEALKQALNETTDTGIVDAVSLSRRSLDLSRTLLDYLDSDSDSGDDSLFDLLLTNQTRKLVLSNPDLVEKITATGDSESDGTEALDLLSMSAEDLMALVKGYARLADASTTTRIDESV